MRSVVLALLIAASAAPAALADRLRDFPAPEPYPFERSLPTGRGVVIPPYEHLFTVRVYTAPPHEPFYNVPPYSVVVPY